MTTEIEVSQGKITVHNESFGLDRYRAEELKQRNEVIDALVNLGNEQIETYCHGATCGCHGGNHVGRPPR